jgi:hypothetical protein
VEFFVNDVREEASSRRGDFYCLTLYCESSREALTIAFQRAVGGVYGHPLTGTPAYSLAIADHRIHHGGVKTVTWTDPGVLVHLSDEARTGLRLPDRHVFFRLDLPVECVALVREGLSRVFDQRPGNLPMPELVGFDA